MSSVACHVLQNWYWQISDASCHGTTFFRQVEVTAPLNQTKKLAKVGTTMIVAVMTSRITKIFGECVNTSRRRLRRSRGALCNSANNDENKLFNLCNNNSNNTRQRNRLKTKRQQWFLQTIKTKSPLVVMRRRNRQPLRQLLVLLRVSVRAPPNLGAVRNGRRRRLSWAISQSS